MKRTFLLLAAALSVAMAAWAATRPRFGGNLSVEMRGSLSSYEMKAAGIADDDFLRDTLLTCVCDRLIALASDGSLRPALATSWRAERDERSWYFTLRKGVIFHSGNSLTPQLVITPLAAANPNWHIRAEGDEVLIQSDTPLADLPYELAAPRNSICVGGDDGRWAGSGPFQLGDLRPGEHVELKAFEQSWQGRPFLDSVHFEMGKTLADQSVDFALGHADLMEGDAPQGSVNSRSQMTEPIELIALVFAPNHAATSDVRLRKAVSLALDRNSISTVLLRRRGEAGGALLPEWISGYAHLFNLTQNLLEAKRLVNLTSATQPLLIGYDPYDPMGKLIAERVAVNAREAGIGMQPLAQLSARSAVADATIVRIRIESPNSFAALATLGFVPRMPNLQKAERVATAEALYGVESEALKDYTIIPIAHVPERFTATSRLHDWRMNRWGEVDWGNLWMELSP